MVYHATLSAAVRLSEQDAAELAKDGRIGVQAAPISGSVVRNGRATPYTLDTTHLSPELDSVLPEHIAMGVVLLGSLIAAIWHLLG